MSFTIPPGSPKAVKAAAFGRELVKACKTRGIPLSELTRTTGVGHTSIDNYRRGLILPKVEVGSALAAALDWPRLAEIIVAARTFECRRRGCGKTFRNDTGAPRKYCSDSCWRIQQNITIAERRARSAGMTKDPRTKEAQIRRLRGGLAIADERGRLLESAIAAMCAGCEPEGVCRLEECPLRPFSPLPLMVHRLRAEPRTGSQIRSDAWTPERAVRQAASIVLARETDPSIATRQGAGMRAWHAEKTPAEHEAWVAKIRATKAQRRDERARKAS